MRKGKKLLTLISSVLLSMVFLMIGFAVANKNQYQFADERVEKVIVTSEQDLLRLGEGIYNDHITLGSDIFVTSAANLCSEEQPFIGIFDGNGYTISYIGEMRSSFLGYLGEEGQVCNLHFQVDVFTPSDNIAGVLAVENNGSIIDCSVTVQEFQTYKNGDYGALVAFNRGLIEHTITSVTFSNKIEDGFYTIGGVSAHNYDKIRYCIAEVNFVGYSETNHQYLIDNKMQNYSIGAVYGSPGPKGICLQNCVIIGDSVDVRDETDKDVLIYHKRSDVFNTETLFQHLLFSEKVWRMQGNQFRLISGRIKE